MGGESRPNRAVVQIAGWAYRLKSRFLKEEFARGGPLQRLLLRYTMALMVQTAQTAVCNRRHSIDQRLSRWLLLTLDHVRSPLLTTTHEQISHMLGVRREGVTEAAGILQKSGLLHCSRGRITVVDRAGLEEHCCECYGVVKREFERLLPDAIELHPRQLHEVDWDGYLPRTVSGLPGDRGAARAAPACRTCAAP